MAKSVFVDGDKSLGVPGTRVLAAFLNKIFTHRHDGLDADGSAPTNYAVAASGDGVTYTASFTPALTAHIEGMPITVKFPVANTVTNPTIDPNGLGPVPMQRKNGVALNIGDIPAGHFATLVYNGQFYSLLNPYLLLDGSVTSEKAEALLGSWDLNTKAAGVNYQAATDILIHARSEGNSIAITLTAFSDASPTPTYPISKSAVDGITGVLDVNITFAVKKGHYWRVEKSAGTCYLNIIPLGS